MGTGRDGDWYYSPGEAWSASGNVNPKTDFLKQARGKYKFPVVTKLMLRWQGSITMSVGNLNGEDNARFYSQVYVGDAHGERVNVTGVALRLINMIEFKSNFVDNAASPTSATYEFWYALPLSPPGVKRARDFGIPLSEILEAGEFRISFSAAAPITNLTINSGTLELWAYVEDQIDAELKSRCVYRTNTGVNKAEDYYQIGGALRMLALIAPNAGAAPGYQSFATFDRITSRTLDYRRVRRTSLVQDYTLHAKPSLGSNDEFVSGTALLLVGPQMDDKTTALRMVDSLHLELDQTPPTGTQMVYCYISERDPEVSSATLGFNDPQKMAAAIDNGGEIKTASGKGTRDVNAWKPELAKILPVRPKVTLGPQRTVYRDVRTR